jgi:DNA modification methylase
MEGHHGGMRRKDGTISGRSNRNASLQPRKIPDSVIRVMRHKGAVQGGKHPAVFPVDLASELLCAFSDPGDLAFEPFSGSGSTIIAAEIAGRRCYAVEIAPAYADVAVRRWEAFTGCSATRATAEEGGGTSISTSFGAPTGAVVSAQSREIA